MTDENQHAEQERSKDPFLVRLFRGLVRLFLVILAGAAIGLCAYLSYLFIFRELVTQPSTDFQEAFSLSETRQALAQERYDEKLADYNERIAVLESQHLLDSEALDELQSDVLALQVALDDQSELLERIAALEEGLEETLDQLNQVDEQGSSNQEAIESVQATLSAPVQSEEEDAISGLLQEVRLLHALELLDRGRLYLLQNNLGLAEEDILAAREILLVIEEAASSEDQQERLAAWIDRLEGVADALPQTPRMASIDLEIVWNRMVTGLDGEGAGEMIPLDFPSETQPETVTPEPTPSETPDSD